MMNGCSDHAGPHSFMDKRSGLVDCQKIRKALSLSCGTHRTASGLEAITSPTKPVISMMRST